MSTIHILLSTYNGELFLEEQIKSIQNQTVENWKLLIRDDGSSDKTKEIISKYEEEDSRIEWINPEGGKNLGVIKSFYQLLKFSKADYYFFCDQDDVWLKDKLSLTLLKAKEYDNSQPLLVYTDLKIVDESLSILHESMIKTQSHHANTKLVQELTENTVTGGTMMINHALADLWTVTDDLLMHDWYLALLAAAKGNLVYLDKPTQLYRQHNDNVLGARTWSKRMKTWLAPHKLVEKYWYLIESSQNQAHHLLSLDLENSDEELVKAFVSIMDQNLKGRVKLLSRFNLRKNRLFHTIVFRILIITKFGYRSTH